MRDVEIKRRGNSLKVKLDNSYQVTDPREDDNLGHLICWHRRYSLGDSNEFTGLVISKHLQKSTKIICIAF